jgi:hypothetical protein
MDQGKTSSVFSGGLLEIYTRWGDFSIAFFRIQIAPGRG